MGYIEEVARADFHAAFGPYAYQEKIPGVTAFSTNSETTVTRRGAQNFGNTGPVAVTSTYMGEAGSVTIEGIEGYNALKALWNGDPVATHVVDDPKRNFPLYLVANSYDEDGTTPLTGRFVSFTKVENKGHAVSPDAKSYNFQGRWAKEFKGKKIVIQVFAGNAIPVTVLTLANAAYQDPNDSMIALAVLRQTSGTKTVTPLAKTTDYTETTSAITLLSGATATEKVLVVYAVA
jgi:hypothetical protein